jgi:hypothetical protein
MLSDPAIQTGASNMCTLIWALVPSLMIAQEAPDWPVLLKRGQAIVESLPPITPKLREGVMLEDTLQGHTVGYSMIMTTSQELEGRPVYMHGLEMIVETPQMTVAGQVASYTDRNLRPIKVMLRRKVKQGDRGWIRETRVIRFKEGSVAMEAEADGRKMEEVMPLATEPFVFPVLLLLQRADVSKLKSFAVREFNPDVLKPERVEVKAARQADGAVVIEKMYPSGKPDFTCRFDSDNKLLTYQEAALPIEGRAVSRQRAQELMRRYGRFETIDSQPAP